MSGFALNQAATLEVVTAYGTARTVVQAVDVSPGWLVLGAFELPKACDCVVEAIGFVADSSLALRVRLFDLTDRAEVSGSIASTNSTTEGKFTSGQISLAGGHLYQVQSECTGNDSPEFFGVVETATISN